jgi:hypothetical protein
MHVNSPSINPPYPVYGGIFKNEAIMLLRRFYVQENENGIYPYCKTTYIYPPAIKR